MATIRNDPFRDLFSLQHKLFRAFEQQEQQPLASAWQPLVDIYEDADGITLKAELPEVDAKDVDIQLDGNTLTLKGERKLEKEDKRDRYHRIERTYGSFARSFTLPSTVDAEHITAESKDGVLKVFLPKKAETRPRQIKIGATSVKH